jgi:hypothetical protein
MKKIKSVLSGDYFARLRAETAALEKLRAALAEALTRADIAAADCAIASYKNAQLRLLAQNPSAAARIRQILPVLRRLLKGRGVAVESARVLVCVERG